MTGFSASVAFALLTLALTRPSGYNAGSICLVASALAVCLAGASRRWTRSSEAWAVRALPWLLGLHATGNLLALWIRKPGVYLTPGTSLTPFRAGLAVVAALALSYAITPGRVRWLDRARFPLIVAIYVALGAWLITASPEPRIDVWHFQQRAADLLLHGQNPWAADYPNIYTYTNFVGSTLVWDGRILSFPYPPLSVLLTVPGALAGDVRWSLLAAVACAGWLIVAAARRRGLPAGHVCELGAVVLVFHARGFFLIEQSWTEPFVALAAAACAWAVAARHPLATIGAVAALLSVKQYGLLLLPALWIRGRVGARALGGAVVLAAIIAVPFVLWDPRALWQGVVAYQFAQPFRPDALSVLAMWASVFGTVPPQGLGFVAATAATAICAWRIPRAQAGSPAAVALMGAATYLAFFAFEKQAFVNYYWFVSALLAIAMTVPETAGEA